MKKNYILASLMLLLPLLIQAQFFPYYFSVESEATYTSLSDSVSLNQGQIWDDPNYTVPIGFTFDFYDNQIENLYIGGTPNFIFTDPAQTIQTIFIPYGSDVIDIGDTSGVNSVSEISYKLEGAVGSQVLRIEYKNVGFYNEVSDLGTANNYLSYQIWFYEGSNDIEIHFGPNKIEDDDLVHDFGGPFVGFFTDFDLYTYEDFSELWYLTDSPDSPFLDTIFTIDQFYTEFEGLENDPTEGTIYRFSTSPPTSVINPQVDNEVSVFPTIAIDVVNVKIDDLNLEGSTLTIFDVTGKQLSNQQLKGQHTRIDVQNLTPGMYFIHINTEEGLTTKKIMKQ